MNSQEDVMMRMLSIGKLCNGVVYCCLAVMLPFTVHAVDLVDTIARIKSGIVAVGTVETLRKPSVMIKGSGFVVGDGKLVVTNAHVVAEAGELESNAQIAVFSGTDSDPDMRLAEVVARDVAHDVAILRIEGVPLPALTLGDASVVREGERYAFTGFPLGMILGLYPVTHQAIISAITPIAVPAHSGNVLSAAQIRTLRNSFKVFQLDATAYPGSSGSPLYDPANGRVVGVINKVFVQERKEHVIDRPSGISYAVPIEYAKALLPGLEKK